MKRRKRSRPVRLGVDVLVDVDVEHLKGLRVGLITNHTGVDSEGVSTIRRLQESADLDLVALFAPEHGIRGVLDEKVGDAVDGLTGLRVYSLYGSAMKPTAEVLEGLDALVYDLQDIGARFYTYITTLSYSMEAAGEHKVHFVVLDRPNPIGGEKVEGPVLDSDLKTFVGSHEIALRHGMTVGELARMFWGGFEVNCDLTIVTMTGWERWMYYEDTGLPWRPTSPAMPSVDAGLCYPGTCLLEPTNVSVGRGTESPFEQIGAPWIDGPAVAQSLNAAGLPGVAFDAVGFTPKPGSRHYGGEPCRGVRLRVTDRASFEPVRTGLHLVCALHALHGDALQIPAQGFDRLCGLRGVREAIEAGAPAAEIEPLLQTGVEDFLGKRQEFLIYE